MPRAHLELAIARLAELGAIVIDEPAGPSSDAQAAPRVPRPPSGVRGPSEPKSLASGEELLEEAGDLGSERRRLVLDTYARLDQTDFYSLLGIASTADKHEVRAAYFGMSKLFHPDTMYGKQLGSYKAMMESVFKRATEAYETLSRRKRREEYDASIGLAPLSVRVEDEAKRRAPVEPKSAPPSPGPPSRAASGPISSVRPRPMVEVTPGAAGPEARFPRPSAPPAPSGDGRPRDRDSSATASRPRDESGAASSRSLHPPSDAARQRILNQITQMTGRSPTPVPPAKPRAPTTSPGTAGASSERQQGRDSILRGLTGSLRDAGRVTGVDPLEQQLRSASAAERSGDLVSASNALRMAHEAAPDREDIAAEYGRVRHLLAKSQADGYERQAMREEKVEMWGAAAVSWSRVAEGRPQSAMAHRRAAHCILAGGGDLKRARDLAQRAVELSPKEVVGRVTLVRVYLAAGMKLNARRELEAAAKLDPKDEFVKNLLRELKS